MIVDFADFEQMDKTMGFPHDLNSDGGIKDGFQTNPRLDTSLVELMQGVDSIGRRRRARFPFQAFGFINASESGGECVCWREQVEVSQRTRAALCENLHANSASVQNLYGLACDFALNVKRLVRVARKREQHGRAIAGFPEFLGVFLELCDKILAQFWRVEYLAPSVCGAGGVAVDAGVVTSPVHVAGKRGILTGFSFRWVDYWHRSPFRFVARWRQRLLALLWAYYSQVIEIARSIVSRLHAFDQVACRETKRSFCFLGFCFGLALYRSFFHLVNNEAREGESPAPILALPHDPLPVYRDDATSNKLQMVLLNDNCAIVSCHGPRCLPCGFVLLCQPIVIVGIYLGDFPASVTGALALLVSRIVTKMSVLCVYSIWVCHFISPFFYLFVLAQRLTMYIVSQYTHIVNSYRGAIYSMRVQKVTYIRVARLAVTQ